MTPSSSPPVLVEMHGHTAVVTLNRPDSRNSLDLDMRAALLAAVQQVRDDAQVRSVVLTGSGKAFCAGGDIRLMQSAAPDPWTTRDRVRRMQLWFRELCNLEKPVVAAVNGAAVGIGTTLLLHCDLVYLGENARLQLPFVNLGLCPEFTASYVLPRMIGHVRAAELLMLGEPFTAQQALAFGLANEVLPPDAVEARARSQALRLAGQAPQALLTTKMLMRRFNQHNMQEALAGELVHFEAALRGAEVKEAVSAFLQKRKPDFHNAG